MFKLFLPAEYLQRFFPVEILIFECFFTFYDNPNTSVHDWVLDIIRFPCRITGISSSICSGLLTCKPVYLWGVGGNQSIQREPTRSWVGCAKLHTDSTWILVSGIVRWQFDELRHCACRPVG